jgi:hypothetical protein
VSKDCPALIIYEQRDIHRSSAFEFVLYSFWDVTKEIFSAEDADISPTAYVPSESHINTFR